MGTTVKPRASVSTDGQIKAALALGEQRKRTGAERFMAIFSRFLPANGVSLEKKIADKLRRAFVDSSLYMFCERYDPKHKLGPILEDDFQGFAEVSLRLDLETAATLANILGMPRIDLRWHGDCSTCVFGPDRGWASPCSSCGAGHICHTPKRRKS